MSLADARMPAPRAPAGANPRLGGLAGLVPQLPFGGLSTDDFAGFRYGQTTTATLAALALVSSVLFSRILVYFGAPSALNFAHFGLVAIAFLMALLLSHRRAPHILLVPIALFVAHIALSGLLNDRPLPSTLLSMTMWVEPFLLLYILLAYRVSASAIRYFLYAVMILELVMCTGQKLTSSNPDDVRGLFLGQLAGQHTGGFMCMSFGIYALHDAKLAPRWRIAWFIAMVVQNWAADAKQVYLVFMLAMAVEFLIFEKRLDRKLKLAFSAFLVGCLLLVMAFTVMPALWIQGSQMPSGVAIKIGIVPFLIEHLSPLQYFIGAGPAAGSSRLATIGATDYRDLFTTLGMPPAELTVRILIEQYANYFSRASSFYALTWSWTALLGEFGLIGFMLYLYCWRKAWRILVFDRANRLLLTAFLLSGLSFSWMEEPAYALTAMLFATLRWLELRNLTEAIATRRPARPRASPQEGAARA